MCIDSGIVECLEYRIYLKSQLTVNFKVICFEIFVGVDLDMKIIGE